MPKAKVYNIDGQIVGERELPAKIFDAPFKEHVVHSAVVAQMANSRTILAHTKDRGEVRGGGKKPWKQKHTGRARHGSIRSPLWVGGGVTFGPTSDRNYSQKINQKVRRNALFMALSDKVRSEHLILVDALTLKEVKTKTFVSALKKLPVPPQVKTLVIAPSKDKDILRAARNVPKVKIVFPDSLNILQVVDAQSVIVALPALESIEKIYQK